MATILIVDDAEFLRMRMSKMLTTNGHAVVQADNGLNAIYVYKSEKPDAVLMDITMPEMDGLTALKEIRELDPQARVIMLTALGQETIVLEALKLGAKDFVVKPFDATRVLTTLQKVLA